MRKWKILSLLYSKACAVPVAVRIEWYFGVTLGSLVTMEEKIMSSCGCSKEKYSPRAVLMHIWPLKVIVPLHQEAMVLVVTHPRQEVQGSCLSDHPKVPVYSPVLRQ